MLMYKNMAQKTKLEVEGGELLIKSSKGIMAVIPKSHTPHVRKLIEEKNFAAVDKFVQSLQPLKRNPNAGKAQDGVVIPPSKIVSKPDATDVATPGIVRMNYIISKRIADNEKLNKQQKELNIAPVKDVVVDATYNKTIPIPPEEDARKPIEQTPPLKTYMVRGIKEVGDFIGVKKLKKGGHPNETYSDVVYRLSHTPGTIANKIEQENPKGLSLMAGIGEAVLDPVNALPLGAAAQQGFKYLAANAARLPKLAAALTRMSKLGKPADMVNTGNDAWESNKEYESRPEPAKEAMTNKEKELVDEVIKNIKKRNEK